jgi:hypothetical protein
LYTMRNGYRASRISQEGKPRRSLPRLSQALFLLQKGASLVSKIMHPSPVGEVCGYPSWKSVVINVAD